MPDGVATVSQDDGRLWRIPVPEDRRDLPGDFRHRKLIEVRFADTDAMGHVNNAKYLTYVETARTRYIEEVILGEPTRLGVYGELSFIVAEVRLAYRSPAHYGETLTVETRTSGIGTTSLQMDHRITAPESPVGQARLVAVCESVLVRYDYGSESPVPVSADEIERIEAFEGRPLRDSR
jgi:acyl-CoA thioester hydrolase